MCHFVLLSVSFLLMCPTFDCLLVLVNNIQMAQVLTSMYDKISKHVEYYYEPGDRVDVSCVRRHEHGRIRLSFDQAKQMLIDYNPDETARDDEWPSRAVGLELVLQPDHDQQQLSCEYEELRADGVATTTVYLKFISNNVVDDVMYFKLNGKIFRLQNQAFYTYFYNKHDSTLNFESVITRKDIPVKSNWEDFEGHHSVDMNKTQIINYKNLSDFQSLVFDIRYSKYNSVSKLRYTGHIRVDFSELTDYKSLGEGSALKLIIPTYSNVVLLSYRWFGDSIYYYEYEDGHSVTLTCEAASKLMATDRYVLNFDGALANSDSMTRRITLSKADDRSTLICSLLLQPAKTVRKMFIVFLLKSTEPMTTTNTTTTKTTNLPTTSISTPKRRKLTTTPETTKIPETTTISETTTALGTTSTNMLPTTISPETSSTPLTTIIIAASGAALIALSVACVVWYVRRKKCCVTTTTGHPLIENNETASVLEHRHGTDNETYHSAPYAYAYTTSEEALTTVPRRPHHPEVYRPPSYDYAYGRPPQRLCTPGVQPPEQPRNSIDSDYTDHYTEIDDYFIQKQMEKRLKRKQVRLL